MEAGTVNHNRREGMIYSDLESWATPRQLEYIRSVQEHGSHGKAARHLGIDIKCISKAVKALKAKAARAGHSPEHDMTRTVPDGYMVRGVSTYYDREGKPAG